MHSAPFRVDLATARRMDCTRGVSSIVVVTVHAVQIFLLPYFGLWSLTHIITSTVALGAVLAFFVISGFMIKLSVDRHTDPSGRLDMRAFAIARIDAFLDLATVGGRRRRVDHVASRTHPRFRTRYMSFTFHYCCSRSAFCTHLRTTLLGSARHWSR